MVIFNSITILFNYISFLLSISRKNRRVLIEFGDTRNWNSSSIFSKVNSLFHSTHNIYSHIHLHTHTHTRPLDALFEAAPFIYWLLNFSLAISFNSHTKAKIQSQRQRALRKNGKGDNGWRSNNNNKQQQQRETTTTKTTTSSGH